MQSELCSVVLGAGGLWSPNTPIVGKTRHPLLMVTTLSMELFQQSPLEDPGNHMKALKLALKHQAGIKICLSARTCRCFSAQSNTGVTQSKVFWHISIIMCGVFFFVHFFLLCFSEIARAHLSCCGDVYLAANGTGWDLLIALPLRSPCSVAHYYCSHHTETQL